ncbi:metabotropic glutamate receptor 2 isoform X1 [Drosophila subpulchrella]|uniref:metabotropic glutamate receptor 2 isoform X1 n=1 Tax=Drosophila subpulchrella TaxID=1486046 RepID=UPI0018A154D1|nr:metabotropic glutamate receptor 2 isoform X1 [Drosophila subpulchrella]XP_037717199.1 metabotropic glutamate receptor 2 isoform X1 [Drosophila subpulchrella]
MQPLLLALMLLLQQQQPLLGGSPSQRQLVGLTDDGRSAAALSDNLNSTLVPGKTIKAIERQMKAAGEVATAPAEMLQVTPANQLPVNTPATPALPTAIPNPPSATRAPDFFMAATMATGNHSAQGELKRTESAATLDAITPAAAVPPAATSEVITAVEATAATSLTREQHMLLPRPTAVQMARINVAATIEDQIGRAVIPSQTNMAETPAPATATAAAATATPTAAIMPAKTKRHRGDGGNKSVPSDGIEFNTDAALSSGYVNATGAWPATTTANIVAVAVAVAAASTISPSLTSTAEGISGKTVPTPRLLGAGFGASNVAQILAKSLDSPPPTSASGWPVKHAAVLEGDVILGGLMMVHSREDSITCGPIMPQGGIQALEAMLYTLDQVNKHQLLPNVTLGAHLLDDCDKDTYGLEMAVDFIKGSISNIDDAEYHCNKTQVRKVISGVVGAASSVTSIQVANLLRLFRIPQVSYFSTSPELSNKQRFEYFSRTIPSDHYQVKAMVEIVKRMGWSYVSIIYEESNYGIKAFEELEELLARHNICIAIKEKLVKDSGVAEDIAYDNIVQKLLTKPRARGAIIFGSDQEVRQVMRAVRRANATGSFSWIGSDGWSARNLVSDDYEPEVEGTLSVQPQANPVRGFEEYFLGLTVENNQRNPWFVEFWEDHFQCRYPGSTSTPYNNYTKQCTKKERLSRQNMDFEDQLQFVSDAVMAFAYALRDMHRDLCGGGPSLCEAMKPTKGADLLKYLRKVEFEGLSGDEFRFDGNGDGPARYNIIHFKQSQAGQYHWVKVGEYTEGELRLNMSEVKFKRLSPKPPESVCSLPCLVGQAKKYVEGESCCWHCFNCTTYQIRHPDDETHCKLCKLGTLPDAHKQYCRPIPEIYLRPESAWAIGAMAFSATGILVTLFVMGVFVRHNDTPIVRASGRELSYILLAGIFMCYGVTFALVLKPTNIVCAIQRFGVGFCFTVVYAALLTKTNRIARIFKAGKQSAKRPSFISPKSQLVICAGLVSVQILINGVWMVIAPSHAMHHYPTREDNLLVCDSYIDASYMIAFSYPIVLIVICTVYAVLTRKIPEAFNESKHIGFTMYTTCVIWLAFVPLYFGTANHVPLRITSMSVTISLSASVTIACLFSPKLYIILIRPERNVRQSMMPPRYGNMHRTAGTGPSSMMAAAVVTAATCAQEEKIQKHITPTNTENSLKAKKLCEMATQTISSIITSMDINAYNQIPYADQYVPNNTTTATTTPTEKGSGNGNSNSNGSSNSNSNSNTNSNGNGNGNGDGDEASEQVVANNNKINQRQHGQPAVAFAITTANNHISGPAATITTTAATGETTTQALATTITTAAGAGDVTETASVAANNGHGNGSQRPPVLQTNL